MSEVKQPFYIQLLKKIGLIQKPISITTDVVRQRDTLNQDQVKIILDTGVTNSSLSEMLMQNTLVSSERLQVYQEVERCLVGETKISLLDGTNPSIKEMADNAEKYVGKSVYSINPKSLQFEPDKIVWVKKTLENATLMRVHLDNEQYVDCTPDHKFMMRDGSFKEARMLDLGDSLMPLYISNNKMFGILSEYQSIYNPADNKFHLIHWLVMKFLTGKAIAKKNNDYQNLESKKFCSNNCRYASMKGKLVLNHKVTRLEYLRHKADTYDIQTEHNHNFALDVGIFVHNSLSHPIMAGASEAYADYATTKSNITGSTVWITSDSKVYQSELTRLLANIEIEERIFDWAWSTGVYGDTWLYIHAQEGVGIISIDDNSHPSDYCRLDYNGRLLGFYRTPQGQYTGGGVNTIDLIPPYQLVHMRLLGVKTKRPLYNCNSFSEFRTINLMAPDPRRITTKYGNSLLSNALPIYKRLRMAEDSIMLARLSKGTIKYIYKVKVESGNPSAAALIIKQYQQLLKRTMAINPSGQTDGSAAFFQDRTNMLGSVEDVILPVFGDTNDVVIEKLGTDTDIKWIVDVDDLRNQLACALRIPLQLLGGYINEGTGALGATSLGKLDIRFARTARRLQRAVLNGIKKLCQVHLAYLGYDPDPRLFDVHITETSSAEELETQEALDKSLDVVQKFIEMLSEFIPEDKLNKLALVDYFNQKLLKLDDFNLEEFLKLSENIKKEANVQGKDIVKLTEALGLLRRNINCLKVGLGRPKPIDEDLDLRSYLPVNETVSASWQRTKQEWEEKVKEIKITRIEEKSE